MSKTVYSHNLALKALAYAVRNGNSAVNGIAIDTAQYKNNFRSVMFVLSTATITDGTHTVTVEESPNNSDWTAIPSSRVQGLLPAIVAADDNVVFSFGVVPNARYVRVVVTDAESTTGGAISAVAILGSGSDNPVARA